MVMVTLSLNFPIFHPYTIEASEKNIWMYLFVIHARRHQLYVVVSNMNIKAFFYVRLTINSALSIYYLCLGFPSPPHKLSIMSTIDAHGPARPESVLIRSSTDSHILYYRPAVTYPPGAQTPRMHDNRCPGMYAQFLIATL